MLNLGAGLEPRLGDEWINLDILPLPNIQVVHNLVFIPYPFEDNQFSRIECQDVLEHLPNYDPNWQPMIPAFIDEMHRILKPGGVLWIRTPGYNAEFLHIDVTHVRGFHLRSMDMWDQSTDFGRSTGFYSKCKFKVSSKELENHNIEFEMVKI